MLDRGYRVLKQRSRLCRCSWVSPMPAWTDFEEFWFEAQLPGLDLPDAIFLRRRFEFGKRAYPELLI